MGRSKQFIAVILFLLCLAVLLKHLSPSVRLGDAGEFISGAYSLGIAHPPGYPLYNLMGRLSCAVPLGSIGWRVNFLSALIGAITISLVFFIACTTSESKSLSILIGLLALSGSLFLEQSLSAEVYIFHAGLIMLMLLLLSKQKPAWTLLSFLTGLGFGIHYMVLYVAPLFILRFATEKNHSLKLKNIAAMLLCFLLGVSCFTYLPIRAIKGPPLNWGSPHNLRNFISHVQRKQYQNLEFGSRVTISDKTAYLKEYLVQTVTQYHFALLFLLAALFSLRKNLRNNSMIILLLLLAGPGVIFLLRFKFEALNLSRMRAYYLPSFLVLAILMTRGLMVMKEKLSRYLPRASYLICLLTLSLISFNLVTNLGANNMRNNYLAYDFGRNMLRSLPKNSVFFTEGDNKTTPLCYTVSVENRRPDIIIFDRSSNLFYDMFISYRTLSRRQTPSNDDEIERFLVSYFGRTRPIIYSLRPDQKKFPTYKLYPYGFFTAILNPQKTRPNPLAPFPYLNYRFRKNELSYNDYLEEDVVANYYFHIGKAFVELGEIERARKVFTSLKRFGARLKHIHNNLGLLFKRYGYWLAAVQELQIALRLDPDYAEAAFNLANLTERIDKKQAIKQWRRYLKIAANKPAEKRFIIMARQNLERLKTNAGGL